MMNGRLGFGVAVLSLVLMGAAHAASAPEGLRLIDRGDGTPARWMTLEEAMGYTEKAHEEGRCGGFFDLTDQPIVKTPLSPLVETFKLNLSDRPMTQGVYLDSALKVLDASRVSETVKSLSQNRNRYYRSQHGVNAAQWIADQFRTIGKNRTDIKVELFKHSWEQPSVIATIAGQGPHQKEIVVIGGHEDSINQSAFGNRDMVAPGADDNATGVATVLEVFRVLVETGFKPDRTLMFMTYAGEEVGLLGSQDIANRFKQEGRAVVAVMQLDMTGYPGAGNRVVFMTDFVNPTLTQFSQKLMDTYVKTPWSTDRCGYACSDHASWNRAGYSSVMPFEATMSTDNKDIHTTRDLIGKLDFNHGLSFMKLGLAFVSELSMN